MIRQMRFALAVPLAALAIAGFAACSDNDDDDDATSTPTAEETATEDGGASPTSDGTAPTTTTPETAVPTAEGTIDPLNAGQTEDWFVKPKPDPAQEVATLVEVRMGVHPEEGGWERIVFEFDGTQLPEATIGYVEKATACGSGEDVDLPGEAVLGVMMVGAQAHNDQGQVTVNVTEADGPGDTILRVEQTCDFEAHVDWFLGMKGVQNFKVMTLESPTRLVVDVKQ